MPPMLGDILMMRQRCRTDLHYLCHVLGYTDVSQKVHGKLLANLHQFHGGEDTVHARKTSTGQWAIYDPSDPKKPSALALRDCYKPKYQMWDQPGPRQRLNMIPRGHL